MQFNQLRVGTRLRLGFGLLILALVFVSALAILRFDSASEQVNEVVNDRMVKVRLFTEFKDNLNAIARIARNVALIIDVDEAAREAARIPPLRERNGEILEELGKVILLPHTKALLNTINEIRPAYNRRMDEAIKLGLTGKPEDAQAATAILIGDLRDMQSALFKAVDESLAIQQKLAEELGAQANRSLSSGTTMVLACAISATLAALLLQWLIARSITGQLGADPQQLAALMDSVAAGDLSSPIVLQPGDRRSVMAAVQRMQASLSQVVLSVREGSETVAAASTQIAHGNMDLSGRTESQASALEQTAASMEELNSTVRHNSDNARQANQLAQNASGVALQGGQVVAQVVDTMKAISASSRKISDIIGVIDGIAFQTNILALNAAVEAARAGEQGRGFAVVATEVRTLARRSAEAAKEIKQLIDTSVEQVEHGAALVDRAGATMEQVVAAIGSVNDIVGEISAASAEQSSGVAQVNDAVTQMDENTQQNAALVEEMAAAATALNHQAQELVQAVVVFKLARDGVRGASPQRAAASHALSSTRVLALDHQRADQRADRA